MKIDEIIEELKVYHTVVKSVDRHLTSIIVELEILKGLLPKEED